MLGGLHPPYDYSTLCALVATPRYGWSISKMESPEAAIDLAYISSNCNTGGKDA